MANEYKTEESDFGTEVSHPSYGTLLFNRSTGGETSLFGSSIQHRDTITMEVYHADITRRYHGDFIHGNKLALRAEMSYSQFAEAITSFGMGTGVPITIRYTEKDGRIPQCDFVSKRQQFIDEFQKHRKDATETAQQLIKDVEDLFMKKKALTKAEKEAIISKLGKLSMDLGCNMDFIAKQFNEQMDKTVMEAKGEIESFYQNKINAIANAVLVENRDEILKLENPVNMA